MPRAIPEINTNDWGAFTWLEYQLHKCTLDDHCMDILQGGAPFPFLTTLQEEMTAHGIPVLRQSATEPRSVWERCFPQYLLNPQSIVNNHLAFSMCVGNIYGALEALGSRYRYSTARDMYGYQKRSFLGGLEASPWRNSFVTEQAFKAVIASLDWQSRAAVALCPDYTNQPRHKPTPWHRNTMLPPIPGHYAHMHPETPASVRYFPNIGKGAAGIYTVAKAGRYIRANYPALTDAELKHIVDGLKDSGTLLFARTTKEVVDVYLQGPRSCMAHPIEEYESSEYGRHPVEVYGDSDIAIAYVREAGAITGRCVCWPERKLYSRIYGHSGGEHSIKNLLEKAGWKYATNLAGARIRKIKLGKNSVLMPYIDGLDIVGELKSDKGEYLRLGIQRGDDATRARYHAQFTGGVSSDGESMCHNCGDYAEHGQDFDGRFMCDECADLMYQCEYSGAWYNEREYDQTQVVTSVDACGHALTHQTWCSSNAYRHAFFDDSLEEYVSERVGSRSIRRLVTAPRNGDRPRLWDFSSVCLNEAAALAEGAVASDGELVRSDDLPAYEQALRDYAAEANDDAKAILGGRR